MKEANYYISFTMVDSGTGISANLSNITDGLASVELVYAAVDMYQTIGTRIVVPDVIMRIQFENPANLIYQGDFSVGAGSLSKNQNIYVNPTRPWRGGLRFSVDDLGNEIDLQFFYGAFTLGYTAAVTLGFYVVNGVTGNSLETVDPADVLRSVVITQKPASGGQ